MGPSAAPRAPARTPLNVTVLVHESPPLERRPMRVAYLIDNLDPGGTELNAARTAERLDRDRFDLRLYALRADGPLRERFESADVPITEVRVSSLASPSAVRQTMRLAKNLRIWGAQVLHCHDQYSNVLGVAAAAAARIPVIASRRWWSFDRRSHAMLNGLAYRMADRVLANAPAVGRLLEREGISAARVCIVPNFVDDSSFEDQIGARERLTTELGISCDSQLVGIVANLRPVKDHGTLIRAVGAIAASHPRLHLVCAGAGETEPALRHLACEQGVENRVHFLGLRSDAYRLHRAFDVSVLCSQMEGFPNSIVEAMAAGTPVIATNVGGIPDAVRHGYTGFLVPPANPSVLAQQLVMLLSNATLRRDVAMRARAFARQHYSHSAVLSKLSTLYEQLGRGSRNSASEVTAVAAADRRVTDCL